MPEPILLLRLEGPLQSWGVRSRWDVRDTQPEPTKSGVVGLLGCALGLPRGDGGLERLDRDLRMGVRVEAPGRVREDFQTVTDFLPTAAGEFKVSGGTRSPAALAKDRDARPATIISPRFYLEDAAFLVALSAEGADGAALLPRCADALRRPRWPLFLGRKACPATRPIFEALSEDYAGLEEALCRHPWSWRGRGDSDRSLSDVERARHTSRDRIALDVYLEDPGGPLTRQDVLRLNAARAYGFRQVTPLTVPLRDVYPKEATS